MRLIISSKRWGKQIVFFDKMDSVFIKSHIWSIRHKGNGRLYAVTNDYKNRKNGKSNNHIMMHRYIMGFPDGEVDHIDGNSLNNTRKNLRVCTHSENMKNSKISKNNTTGFKGVFFEKVGKKYFVQIMSNGVLIREGRFLNKKDAARRYNELAIKHHGKFANLNKI